MAIKWPWSRKASKQVEMLGELLAQVDIAERLLGTKPVEVPDRDKLDADASKFLNYSRSGDFQILAEKSWERYLMHMDSLMNESSTPETVSYHRGAANEVLYLLRLSYEAREAVKARSEREQSASLPR
jgi:hypothetical protein